MFILSNRYGLRYIVIVSIFVFIPRLQSFSQAQDKDVIKLLPEKYQSEVVKSLKEAEQNRQELFDAIEDIKENHREALAFLIANMPQIDLEKLKKDFLIENIEYAYKAREETSWGKNIPDELFLNYVLPYANVNENRDNWRKDFHEKFLPLVKNSKTITEAVLKLNKDLFEILRVKYHPTKRPRPDQGPYESIKAGYASCTGLSILLIDACRAVGIPARISGIPSWTTKPGNHTWVEIWDGQWYFIGASEDTPLNQTWFVKDAEQADPAKPEHRIYAASFKKTATHFPLVWDTTVKYVSAIDVTKFYMAKRKVRIQVFEKEGAKPQKAEITIRLNGEIIAKSIADIIVEFELGSGLSYHVEVKSSNSAGTVEKEMKISEGGDQSISIYLNEKE